MGGGLFGTPLYLNPKCLVFSAFVLAVYWLPHPKAFSHRFVAAFLLACAAYIILAWYDYIYECTDELKPTILGWLWGWAKPPGYQKKFDDLPVRYKKIVTGVDIGVLIVVIGALVYPYYQK
jgi:hypothetical protein